MSKPNSYVELLELYRVFFIWLKISGIYCEYRYMFKKYQFKKRKNIFVTPVNNALFEADQIFMYLFSFVYNVP